MLCKYTVTLERTVVSRLTYEIEAALRGPEGVG